MKKTGLGRGLDALLPGITDENENDLQNISLNLIDRNENQPRRTFDEESLRQLADSIRANGMLQPILVVSKRNRYQIVAGERRFRAARIAGLDTLPCIVKDLTPAKQKEIALIENLQREELNPIEEAAAIKALMTEHKLTQEEVADALGKSRPRIANTLRLLNLEKTVQDDLVSGALSAGHGRALAALGEGRMQRYFADRAIKENLSVRALESLISQTPKPKNVKRPALSLPLRDMEDRLREAVGVKVSVKGTEKSGSVTLHYYSADELDSIYAALERLEK